MALSSTSTSYSLRELFRKSANGEVTIGRHPDSVLLIKSHIQNGAPLMLSRSHAKLAVQDGHLQLWDCGSVNGTWVNTQQLKPLTWKMLHDGDVVTFGGPPDIKVNGLSQPNPWRFTVCDIQPFLATYTPTERHMPPPPQQQQQQAPPRAEVFRFFSGPAQQQAAEPAAGPNPVLDPTQEFFRFTHPSPLREAGSAPPLGAPGPAQQGSPERGPDMPAAPPPPQQVRLGADAPASTAAPAAGTRRHHSGAALVELRAEERSGSVQSVPQGTSQRRPQAAVTSQCQGMDVIDLTMDDSPVGRTNHGSQAGPRLPLQRRRGQPAASLPAASRGGAQAAMVVEDSPPKRREHDSLQQQVAQHKRPKPSDDSAPKPAYVRVVDAAGPSSHAASAAAPHEGQASAPQPAPAAGASAQAGPSSDLDIMTSTFMCAICQEMLVHCVSTVPCGHLFCGECMSSWLANKTDCPTCRSKCTAPPVWQPSTDCICNEVLEKKLSAEDMEERQRRKQQWEDNRVRFEKALKAPWEQRGGSNNGRGGQRGGDRGGRLMDAVLQMMLAGGPVIPPEVLLGGGRAPDVVDFAPPAAWGPRDRARHDARRGPPPGPMGMEFLVQPPGHRRGSAQPPPLPLPPQQPHQFRVEYARPRSQTACATCHAVLNNNVLRVGVAQPPASRREAQSPNFTAWYHLDCVPIHYWTEMRTTGIQNMRGISASDQAQVRTRQDMQR